MSHVLGQKSRSVILSQNPNFDHFAPFMIWIFFLRNCDPNFMNWQIWLQNVDIGQKYWSLIVCWPQLTFYPIQLIFGHLSNWLSKLVMQCLKFGMRINWDIWGTMKFTWGIISSNFLEKCETLIVGQLLRRRICLIKHWVALSNCKP